MTHLVPGMLTADVKCMKLKAKRYQYTVVCGSHMEIPAMGCDGNVLQRLTFNQALKSGLSLGKDLSSTGLTSYVTVLELDKNDNSQPLLTLTVNTYNGVLLDSIESTEVLDIPAVRNAADGIAPHLSMSLFGTSVDGFPD